MDYYTDTGMTLLFYENLTPLGEKLLLEKLVL